MKPEDVNKPPHLESTRFALSAEQTDLIHAVCLLGKTLKENQRTAWSSGGYRGYNVKGKSVIQLLCIYN